MWDNLWPEEIRSIVNEIVETDLSLSSTQSLANAIGIKAREMMEQVTAEGQPLRISPFVQAIRDCSSVDPKAKKLDYWVGGKADDVTVVVSVVVPIHGSGCSGCCSSSSAAPSCNAIEESKQPEQQEQQLQGEEQATDNEQQDVLSPSMVPQQSEAEVEVEAELVEMEVEVEAELVEMQVEVEVEAELVEMDVKVEAELVEMVVEVEAEVEVEMDVEVQKQVQPLKNPLSIEDHPSVIVSPIEVPQNQQQQQQQLEEEGATIPTGTTHDVEPMPLFVLDLQVCENLTSISHSPYLYLILLNSLSFLLLVSFETTTTP